MRWAAYQSQSFRSMFQQQLPCLSPSLLSAHHLKCPKRLVRLMPYIPTSYVGFCANCSSSTASKPLKIFTCYRLYTHTELRRTTSKHMCCRVRPHAKGLKDADVCAFVPFGGCATNGNALPFSFQPVVSARRGRFVQGGHIFPSIPFIEELAVF
jgi:hypothetical protein